MAQAPSVRVQRQKWPLCCAQDAEKLQGPALAGFIGDGWTGYRPLLLTVVVTPGTVSAAAAVVEST